MAGVLICLCGLGWCRLGLGLFQDIGDLSSMAFIKASRRWIEYGVIILPIMALVLFIYGTVKSLRVFVDA